MGRRGNYGEDTDVGISPENPLSFAEKNFESEVQSNPLLFGRPSLRDQYSEPFTPPAAEGVSPEVAAANPLITPPRPVKYMPVEQQIIWNQMHADALDKQVQMQSNLTTNKARAHEMQMKLDQEAQSSAIIDAFSSDDIDPNKDDYISKKGKLFAANSLGAMSEAVQRAISWKDSIYEHRQKLADAETERKAKAQEALNTNRVNQVFKDAADLGDPALIEAVSKAASENPEAALALVQKRKGEINQANINTQLRDQYGMSNEEITKRFYDYSRNPEGDFLQGAAQAHLDSLKTSQSKAMSDETHLMEMYSNLSKRKTAAAQFGGEGWDKSDDDLLANVTQRLKAKQGVAIAPPTAGPANTAGVAPPVAPQAAAEWRPEWQTGGVTPGKPAAEKKVDKIGDVYRLRDKLFRYEVRPDINKNPRWYPMGG
jgi:hypothetical protein